MNRAGETNKNSLGESYILFPYVSANEVYAVFKGDNASVKTTYQKFIKGNVYRDEANMDNKDWVGITVKDEYDEECKIVAIADNIVTLQYPDGDIVTKITLDDAVNGNFNRENNIPSPLKERDIRNERKRTYENVKYMVDRFKRCVIIRPCGFGKTKIGMKLFESPEYHRCLFLHPISDDVNAEIIKKSHSKKRIDAKTYSWLRNQTEEQIKKLDYDLVFCDEVHCIGGNDDGDGAYYTYKAMKTLMESHPNTHFVGATATALRMDGINVVSTMFHNHVCYPYTLEDALEDGLLKRPSYYYCVYNALKKVRDELKKTTKVEMSQEDLRHALKLSADDIDEIDTRFMDKHIRLTCDSILPDTKYMRFIAFYLTNEEIMNNKDKVLGWFKTAYPEHEVKSITVTNRTDKSLKDVDNLPTEPSDPKYKGRIDIIFNCEKLCMGYHSEKITGLVLDRKTQSLAKYMQMIGRLLSCDSDRPVIIFDVVDNIHSDFIFKVKPQEDADFVHPVFDVSPKTYEEIRASFPKARHWDEIARTNKKARKAEKIMEVSEAIAEDRSDVTISEETMHEVEEAKDLAKAENLTFEQAVQRLSGIADEFIPNIETPNKSGNHTHIQNEAKEIARSLPSKPAKSEPLGFDPMYYYNADTREMFSKNVYVVNRRADFEEDIKSLVQSVQKKHLDQIIKDWHSFEECEGDYKDYGEIDKNSHKYKMLKSVSQFTHGVPVEITLLYMIEGKIA